MIGSDDGRVTTLLLDFFGTLVDYSPSRTEQGYPATDAVLRAAGLTLPYERWLAEWDAVATGFDQRTATSWREFSMEDLVRGFVARVGLPADDVLVDAMVETYVGEWNAGVTHIDGVGELLRTLASSHRLAVVTNTHHPGLVPDHLAAMGVDHHLDAVVMSVEVGWRKPHPDIYRAALDRVGASAGETLFVGDNREADYDGPRRNGMPALLIDPDRRHDVPSEHRLATILELPERLAP